MINWARKLGVQFVASNPHRDVLLEMPLWHHFGEDTPKRQINNNARCRCVRDVHGVFYVRDAMAVILRLTDASHTPKINCLCYDCVEDRALKHCKNPHSCAMTDRTRLDRLLPKW
ncbi:hypothetical protein FB451DRAFT_959977, partial [Mycena latifolia]